MRDCRKLAMLLAIVLAVDVSVADGTDARPRCPPGGLPDWAMVPSSADFNDYYPHRTDLPQTGGAVKVRCTVSKDGRLAACVVASEVPAGVGFGAAALRLTRYFKVRAGGCPLPGARVTIPIRFKSAD
jgi:protein TonB